MDFHSILSIAEQKQEEKKRQDIRGLSTKFSAPRKEQKQKEIKSETIKKLIEEKEREKQEREHAQRRKKREEEKAKRFRIPKSGSKGESDTLTKKPLPKSPGGSVISECVEEVVIHKEDFVKSSSKKRLAHNPAFFNRPTVAPVKVEDEGQIQPAESTDKHRHKDGSSSKRSKSSSDISNKSSSSKSADKNLNSSKSSSNLSEKSLSHSMSSHSKSSHSKSSHSSSSKPRNVPVQTNNDQKTTSLKGKSLSKAANQYQLSKTGSDVKPKPRPAAPPPMGFEALLKLAEQKHKEPVKVDLGPKPVKSSEDSLMTQEEKDRLIRTKSKVYKEWLKVGKSNTCPEDLIKSRQKPCLTERMSDKSGKVEPNIKSDLNNRSQTDRNKMTDSGAKRKLQIRDRHSDVVPKISKADHGERNGNGPSVKSKVKISKADHYKRNGNGPSIKTKVNISKADHGERNGNGPSIKSKVKISKAAHGERNGNGPSIKSKVNLKEKMQTNIVRNSQRPAPTHTCTSPGNPPKQASTPALPKTKPNLGRVQTKVPNFSDKGRPKPAVPVARKEQRPSTKYSSTHENVLVCGPTKKAEPAKSQNPFDRIYSKIQQNRPVKRRIEDDEEDSEEEWSDEDEEFIDDFIDDGEEEDDYRKHLKDMFGYSYTDRFRNFDDRDDNMEASFAQQMKEEARSTRLGKLEDLEDMRKEEEELRRKKLAKKKKLKR